MAAEHWFRWHHGTVSDPKWRVVASRCVTNVTVGHVLAVWAAMMENASLASPRGELDGWNDEDVAAGLGFATEQVKCIRDAMQGKCLNQDVLTGWEKRQPKREDSSNDRTKAWRLRQLETASPAIGTVTQCDAERRTETLETETETDKIKSIQTTPSSSSVPEKDDDVVPGEQDLPEWVPRALWREFYRHRAVIRKPLSIPGQRQIVARLIELSELGHDIATSLRQTIAAGLAIPVIPKEPKNGNVQPSRRLSAVERVSQANDAAEERAERENRGFGTLR